MCVLSQCIYTPYLMPKALYGHIMINSLVFLCCVYSQTVNFWKKFFFNPIPISILFKVSYNLILPAEFSIKSSSYLTYNLRVTDIVFMRPS